MLVKGQQEGHQEERPWAWHPRPAVAALVVRAALAGNLGRRKIRTGLDKSVFIEGTFAGSSTSGPDLKNQFQNVRLVLGMCGHSSGEDNLSLGTRDMARPLTGSGQGMRSGLLGDSWEAVG